MLLLAWVCGLLWFVANIPESPSDSNQTTDAIVVLTGGAGRLEHGIKLLSEQKAEVLFITGVGGDGTLKEVLSHAQTLFPDSLEGLKEKIKIGNKARTTFGNAEEVKDWLSGTGYHSIRLVTANYHMPRSVLIFSHTLPGITIVTDPVMPKRFSRSGWLKEPNSLRLTLSEYNKYILSSCVILFHAVV
ncbi:MAG: YdcF family protein [Rickettsiales bacterium]